ncbi:hypothetical protein ACHAO1_007357 [Botrytis cinerea]
MPLTKMQKSKLANKPTLNDRTIKRAWLHTKLYFQLPEHNLKRCYKPQDKLVESWLHEVPESRKTPSRTRKSQTSGSPSGRYFESPQPEPTARAELVKSTSEFRIQMQPWSKSRARPSSSRSSTCSGPPRTPLTMKSERHTGKFSDFDHFPPRKEHHKSQIIVKEIKHARPQKVIAGGAQRCNSTKGSIYHKSPRISSSFGSSSTHSLAEQFKTQDLEFKMLEEEYHHLEAHDGQMAKHQSSATSLGSEARSHKSRPAATSQSPERTRRVEARPLPPTPPPHQLSEISVRSSARSYKPQTQTISKPSERTRQLGPIILQRVPIPHQKSAIPTHSSVEPNRSRAPVNPISSENINQLETRCPPRVPIYPRSPENISHLETRPLTRKPITHQPSTRPPKPRTQTIPKPSENTNQLEARPSPPVLNTHPRRRERPLKLPKPRPPVPSSVSKSSFSIHHEIRSVLTSSDMGRRLRRNVAGG